MDQKNSQPVAYHELNPAPMTTPTWDFVQNTDVISSASAAALFLLLQKRETNLFTKFIPGLLIFALTEAFLLAYYRKEQPYRSNYNFMMDSAANVLSVGTSTAATALVFSAAAFYPAMATGMVASMVTVGAVRFLARVTKWRHDARTGHLENNYEQKGPTPSLTESVFQNFYVTASISTGISLALFKNHMINNIAYGAWNGANLLVHLCLQIGVQYIPYLRQSTERDRSWICWRAYTDLAAFNCPSLLPTALSATFALTGTVATIVSGTAAIIAINIGAAAAVRILSVCAATFFKRHDQFNPNLSFTATPTANNAADEKNPQTELAMRV